MKPLLTTFAIVLASFPCHAALVITEVMSSSAHSGGTNNADWFELTNNGPSSVDLTGWTWNDSDTSDANTSLTNAGIIGSGQSIILTGEPAGEESAWISNWGLSGITVLHQGSAFHNFSSGGDTIQIYDQTSALVVSIIFGTATTGFSFEWDRLGNSLGNSGTGENGAAAAISNGQTVGNGPGVDIGSPGLSLVPEPGTALLSAIAMLGLLGRRSRS